jgi:FkbM family methyltransferase
MEIAASTLAVWRRKDESGVSDQNASDAPRTNMTFISYAQNFEDVMLRRALMHVDRGFYIDVGAYSPDIDSVTRAFYERGWRGINIEPNPAELVKFSVRRPDDVNLGFVVSERDGEATLNIIEDTGLATIDTGIAERHTQAGWKRTTMSLPARQLSRIWDEYVPADQPVHFLKVDVEGHEEAVLRGADWMRHRPWIVVVEATLPSSQVETHLAWEPILTQASYVFAYADGLNRFYCASEHAELLSSFKFPPNVFDGFAQEGNAQFAGELARLAEQNKKLTSQVATALEQVQQLQARNKYLEDRTGLERILFRASGKPKWAVRRVLFHNNGKPRGIFKKWVLRKDGRPHWPFRPWMESQSYLVLPRAVKFPRHELHRSTASLSPRAQYFLKRIEAARLRS